MKAEQIKELRLKLDITQVEFAHKIDVQPVTVSRWERGIASPSKPSIREMKKLG